MKSLIVNTIRKNASDYPEKICLWHEDKNCTYGELLHKIDETVCQLEQYGIVKNKHRVFLSGNNSIELIVLFIALMELEAEVVLVDPKSTKTEIEQLLVSIPVNFLLLEEEIFKQAFSGEQRIFSYQFLTADSSYQNKRSAFVTFFSSGSTGEPKAFGFPEEKLIKMVLNLASYLHWNENDKVLCPVSFTHSHGVMMTLPFLLIGASVNYLHPKNCDPKNILKIIQKHRATILTGVPFQYQKMLEEDADANALRSLRYTFCGSAPMSEHLAINFEKKFGVRINQAYGVSEIGPVCVNLFEEENYNFQSVGKVIRHIDYKIVDEKDNKVNTGEDGELLVRSAFMTEGYLNADNHSLFRNGWMCTQDIVREDQHRNIFILGRKSGFINVSGYKVYPVEVEKVLLSMKGIKEAAVISEEDELRTQTLKAFVTTFFPLTEEEVKAYCREHLSKYKIPHQIIMTDELPTNSIGKVIASKLKE